MSHVMNLCAGEMVEVRSKAEILATLDLNGRLEELPFMPEMLRYCGQRFRVLKRAHKTCDFVTNTGGRSLPNAVHLEGLRCDGSAHGGCMAECLLFWKEAWLKRVSEPLPQQKSAENAVPVSPTVSSCTEEAIWRGTVAAEQAPTDADPTYVCQATLLPTYTRPLAWWDARQFVEDYKSGNVNSFWSMVPRFLYRGYDNLINLGVGLGPALRWLYDVFQSVWGGVPYPVRPGKIGPGEKTPAFTSNLQPGELVRVKDHRAILETIDARYMNRGLTFSAEMAPYCGGVFRVHRRVDRIIDEKTGKMIRIKNACIMLEGVVCQAKYNAGMIFCPRATYAYWREIWLERVADERKTELGRNDSATLVGTFIPSADTDAQDNASSCSSRCVAP